MEKSKNKIHFSRGQTALEYMLLFGVVVAIVMVGFVKYLPRTYQAANVYFDKVSEGIAGKGNRCGDGHCDGPPNPGGETNLTCCEDCGAGCNWGSP
jgi:Flp pilus assembly pilin Flp